MDILKLFTNKSFRLTFSLLSGIAYYVIILRFILSNTENGGMLLAFFFFPAIICGCALLIYKAAQNALQNENTSSLKHIFFTNIIIAIIAALMLVSYFI